MDLPRRHSAARAARDPLLGIASTTAKWIIGPYIRRYDRVEVDQSDDAIDIVGLARPSKLAGRSMKTMEFRRIRADEGLRLRALRLRALADLPMAYGSTFAKEELYSETIWHERAARSAAGDKAVTIVAERDNRFVGMAMDLSPTQKLLINHSQRWSAYSWTAQCADKVFEFGLVKRRSLTGHR